MNYIDMKFPFLRTFANRLNVDMVFALGLIDLLQEASIKNELNCIDEDEFWRLMHGKIDGVTAEEVIDAYHRYLELLASAQAQH